MNVLLLMANETQAARKILNKMMKINQLRRVVVALLAGLISLDLRLTEIANAY